MAVRIMSRDPETKRTPWMRFIRLTLFLAILHPGPLLEAQQPSLVDLARKERERRARSKEETPVITNETVAEAKGLISTGSAPDRENSDPEPARTPPVSLGLAGYPSRGSPKARLTLMEFSDYQCPFCARHVRETLPQIERNYIRPGKLHYVFRDFPLTEIHGFAFEAAQAAHCAGDQGKYWEMHDHLFRNFERLNPGQLDAYGKAVGLDTQLFQRCLESGRYVDRVRSSLSEGSGAGVQGTPFFFLGLSSPRDRRMRVQAVISGAQSYEYFKQVIDRMLASEEFQD